MSTGVHLRPLLCVLLATGVFSLEACGTDSDRDAEMKGTENNRPVETQGLTDDGGSSTTTGSVQPSHTP